VCLFLIYSSINYARNFKPISLMVLAVALGLGILIYVVTGVLGMNPGREKFAQQQGGSSSHTQ
jgi:hypothetical protein